MTTGPDSSNRDPRADGGQNRDRNAEISLRRLRIGARGCVLVVAATAAVTSPAPRSSKTMIEDDANQVEQLRPIPIGSLGSARVQIDIDEETYRRLRAEYRRAVGRGYSEGFDTFALNHCSTDYRVTVDGEDAVREALDGAGDTVTTPDTSDGSDTDDAVATIREALKAAKEAGLDDRDEHIKTALGEVLACRAGRDVRASELQEQLTNVLSAPPEEGTYFINQSLRLLENVEEDLEADGGEWR